MKFIRLFVPAIALAGLTACGGGGGLFGGSIPGGNGGGYGGGTECVTGTSEELANPQPGATAQNVTAITIVASGNTNALYDSYQSWNVFVTNSFTGQTIQGGQLSLVSDPNGPHPYASDYYYSSQLQQTVPSGGNWSVYLTQYNGNCNSVPLQGFST